MSQYLGRNRNKGYWRKLPAKMEFFNKMLERQAKEMIKKDLEQDESKEIVNK